MAGGFFGGAARLGIAAADGALAQSLDLREQFVAGLFAQHCAQQCAQRAHIAAQRSLFQLAGLRFQFGQPLGPALGIPQKSHRYYNYARRRQVAPSGSRIPVRLAVGAQWLHANRRPDLSLCLCLPRCRCAVCIQPGRHRARSSNHRSAPRASTYAYARSANAGVRHGGGAAGRCGSGSGPRTATSSLGRLTLRRLS